MTRRTKPKTRTSGHSGKPLVNTTSTTLLDQSLAVLGLVEGTAAHGESESETSTDAAATPADLELVIAEKQALIELLTERLEATAEELDRYQRTGPQRSQGSPNRAVGIPSELLQSHQQVVNEFQQMLADWEDVKAGQSLLRLESQVAEIRDLLETRLPTGLTSSFGAQEEIAPFLSQLFGGTDQSATSNSSEAGPVVDFGNEANATDSSASPGSQSAIWQSISQSVSAGSNEAPSEFAGPHDFEPIIEAAEIPSPIDPETCARQEMEAALNQRDAYISYLIKKLRASELSASPPDWLALEKVPESLCEELNGLRERLEQQLRLAEVELSVDRARVARDQAKVRQQQELVDKHMKRLGITSIDEVHDEISTKSAADKRWLKFLGVSRK
jgi:hypothetical protein